MSCYIVHDDVLVATWWNISYAYSDIVVKLGNISHQASRFSYWNRWRETWKSESCHHIHTWGSPPDHRHESGDFLDLFQSFIWTWYSQVTKLSTYRIITLRKLSKWEMYLRNFWKLITGQEDQQYWDWENIFLQEGWFILKLIFKVLHFNVSWYGQPMIFT